MLVQMNELLHTEAEPGEFSTSRQAVSVCIYIYTQKCV